MLLPFYYAAVYFQRRLQQLIDFLNSLLLDIHNTNVSSVIKSSVESNMVYNGWCFLSTMPQQVFNQGFGLLIDFLNSLLPNIHNRNVPSVIKSSVKSDMIYNGYFFLSIMPHRVFNEGYGLLIDFLNSLLLDIHRDSSRMLQ